MSIGQPFTLGVNYWPRRKAMYWWKEFDAGEVAEEFAVIREIGLDLVRIFLLWEDWQPTPDVVDTTGLHNLERVCDIAADEGLKLDVTFFTGHMSGPNWIPSWLLRQGQPVPPGVRQVVSNGTVVNTGYVNPYTDPTAIEAGELLLNTVVHALRDHPAVGMWNLGNEPDLVAHPPTPAQGSEWAARMRETIRTSDKSRPVTLGLHADSLVADNGFRVDQIFEAMDMAVMHGYPMYMPWAKGPLDADFVPFLCALTTALCGKPTLMEEFGGCTTSPGQPSEVWHWTGYGQEREQFMAGEEAFAGYIAAVLPKLVEVGATGALLWCYADYVPALYDKPPCDESRHERFVGLVRPDGSLKPHAGVLRDFAATKPTVQPAVWTVELDITADEYYANPFHHAQRLYAKFLAEKVSA